MSRILSASLFVGALLWLGSLGERALAQDLAAMLLRQICEAQDIRGSECTNAKNYPQGSTCNVKLSDDRHVGRFISGQTILLVGYQSDCEAHATDNGGAIVFEQTGASHVFHSYQPGLVITDCITIPRSTRQDRLICLTGHMGQGFLESTVSEVVFTRDFSKSISAALDVLVTATDSAGAYGVNKIDCKESRVLFGFSKLERGRAADTVLVTVEYADRGVIARACRRGVPKPKDVVDGVTLSRGEAFVDPKRIKNRRFTLDLETRTLRRR